MWSSYTKIVFRNFRRQPFFTFINISGLAVGLAACWLLGLYILHENSYDRFLPQADRICAVALDLKMGDMEGKTTNTPPPIGPRLAADFPEIELTARTFNLGSVIVRREQPGHAPLMFTESAALAADTAFLELFGFPMVYGDARSALDRPGSMVITQQTAEKYFGKEPAVGQSLMLNDRLFNITAVVADLPSNSTVRFDFLVPMADYKVVERFAWSWIWLQMDTWARLREAATTERIAALESRLPVMVKTYAPAAFERVGQNFEAQMQKGDRYDIRLLPLPKLHLGASGIDSRLSTLGSSDQMRLFGMAGALILLLACVNFMNLSTARSMNRAREVGVRKSLGSQRSALVAQFLTESMVLSLAAFVCSAGLAGLALPWFNRVTGLHWSFTDLFAGGAPAAVFALPLVSGLIGGLYPAFYLSKFKPATIFKPVSGRSGHAAVRSGLAVFQFAVSMILMLGAFVVYRQLEFARNGDKGMQREHVLLLPDARFLETESSRTAFRAQLLQFPEIESVTYATYLPSLGSFGDFYEPEQGDDKRSVPQNLLISSYLTDDQFVPSLGLDLLQGRNFYPAGKGNDSCSVILNEAAVKAIGWENPLGKWLRYPGNENQRFQVVGVMRNFQITSVKMAVEPVALFHESSKTYRTWGSYAAMRLKPGTEKAAVDKTAALWKTVVPAAPFQYDFLDSSFDRLYTSERKTASVLSVFAVLALFIGCLGMFALAAFTAEQRTKEIGIRKVLGASVAGISTLLTMDFLKLVLYALLIAAGPAWFFMQRWLADFAYRIELQWWMFALVGLVSMAVATLTVGAQSVRAALVNPIRSLKSE